ncbi:hypothetical protein [Actinosynnema sp. NPDC023587]|uniref:hypothetical protein n=1 Tax=Actinosynnema sp. NPDC023587 TaxID=3154695 RepID=UPI00340B8DFB
MLRRDVLPLFIMTLLIALVAPSTATANPVPPERVTRNTEALIRFAPNQGLTPTTFPQRATLVYRYAVSPSLYTTANVRNDDYRYVASEQRWYMHITFPGAVQLWNRFYEGSTITYQGRSYKVEYGRQLN